MRLNYSHIKLDIVDSTNSYLSVLNINKGIDEGTVVTAKHQTNGKGQKGNIWYTIDSENLTFSVLLKSNIEVKYAFYLNIIASLAVHKTLADLQIDALIKWPNDILVNQKKIGGILIENQISGVISQSIIGIGLNVNQINFNSNLIATSIALEKNKLKIEDVQVQLLGYLDFYYSLLLDSNFSLLLKHYYKNMFWFQKTGTFNDGITNFTAKILGISELGLLKLQKEDSSVKLYDLKDIKFIY